MHTFHLSPAWAGSFTQRVASATVSTLHSVKSALIGLVTVSTSQEPRNAMEVLVWARSLERVEPGFAADLRAAALRALD